MKKALLVIGSALLIVGALANVALAAPTNLTTEVTPYFTGLANQAMDLVPLALTVIGIGVAFGIVRSWFKRSRG